MLMASNFEGDEWWSNPIPLRNFNLHFLELLIQRIPRIPLKGLLFKSLKTDTLFAEKDKALGLENDQAPDVPVQIEPEKRLLYGDSEQRDRLTLRILESRMDRSESMNIQFDKNLVFFHQLPLCQEKEPFTGHQLSWTILHPCLFERHPTRHRISSLQRGMKW